MYTEAAKALHPQNVLYINYQYICPTTQHEDGLQDRLIDSEYFTFSSHHPAFSPRLKGFIRLSHDTKERVHTIYTDYRGFNGKFAVVSEA